MDLCPLKNSELELQFQKYKVRVVLRGGLFKDDSGSYAVFTEQGSSASQMTAAKVMDVVSTLPGCAGQAADAVSAYTQINMEDAPLASVHKFSACLTEAGLENQSSDLPQLVTSRNSLSSLLGVCALHITDEVLQQIVSEASTLAQDSTANVMASPSPPRLFAPGEPRPLFSLRHSSVEALASCILLVQTPVPARPSATLQGNYPNAMQAFVRHPDSLFLYRHLARQMSIHIDTGTTLQRS